jgi:hypothetical protein
MFSLYCIPIYNFIINAFIVCGLLSVLQRYVFFMHKCLSIIFWMGKMNTCGSCLYMFISIKTNRTYFLQFIRYEKILKSIILVQAPMLLLVVKETSKLKAGMFMLFFMFISEISTENKIIKNINISNRFYFICDYIHYKITNIAFLYLRAVTDYLLLFSYIKS